MKKHSSSGKKPKKPHHAQPAGTGTDAAAKILTITIGTETIPYTVSYSARRKNLTLEIDAEARVTVKAPRGAKTAEIHKLFLENTEWLLTNLAVVRKGGISGTEDATVTYNGVTYPYTVRYHPLAVRYTMKIQPDNAVRVTAPARASREDVRAFVTQNAEFIHEKITAPERRPARLIEYTNGGSIRVHGEEVTICVTRSTTWQKPEVREGKLMLTLPRGTPDDDPRIPQVVAAFLRYTTLTAVVRHLPTYAGLLNIPVPAVDCRRYKTCWGKCIPDRHLIVFNERLGMLPEDLIGFVVAHECCHFHHRNHSKTFYETLTAILPDADDQLKRLKTYSSEYLPGRG